MSKKEWKAYKIAEASRVRESDTDINSKKKLDKWKAKSTEVAEDVQGTCDTACMEPPASLFQKAHYAAPQPSRQERKQFHRQFVMRRF